MAKKGKVVIIGAGRSGRGYLAELCHLEGYEITLADADQSLVKALKEKGCYHSFRQNDQGDGFLEIPISGYTAVHIHADREIYIRELAQADLIFTATFDDAFESIVQDMKDNISYRMSRKMEKQFVFLLGANYIGLHEYYTKAFSRELTQEELAYLEQYCVMVESIIYRVSSFPTPEQKEQDPLSIQSDNFNVLQVNTGQIARAAEVVLPEFFADEEDTLKFMHCKIWDINTSHCSLAYLGQFYKKQYICDAANDDYISKCAYYAADESYRGLARRYGKPLIRPKEAEAETWGYYRDATVKDTVERVGNDPLRKLRRNDRFIGAALNAIQHGITPVYICQNAAYGFFFHNEGDERTDHLHQIVKEKGIEQAIMDICGLNLECEYEKIIYDLILAKYREITKENPVDCAIYR